MYYNIYYNKKNKKKKIYIDYANDEQFKKLIKKQTKAIRREGPRYFDPGPKIPRHLNFYGTKGPKLYKFVTTLENHTSLQIFYVEWLKQTFPRERMLAWKDFKREYFRIVKEENKKAILRRFNHHFSHGRISLNEIDCFMRNRGLT